MTHDPLCPELWRWDDGQPCMFCALITRVRDDERMSFDRSKEYLAYEMALWDAVEAVKAYYNDGLGHDFQTCTDRDHSCYLFAEAIAAIEALGGKQ